ncbi:MAG TPA: twin-arginine translocase TatA/TatE family subunit [Chromatiaceae bacterium]|nr:twin-arginine translocase TatA/TatE family subunit [Chromatiaceae bacterium]
MFELQSGELLIILIALLLIFGPKKLPELARGIGRAMYEFRRATRSFYEYIETATEGRRVSSTANEALKRLAKELLEEERERR